MIKFEKAISIAKENAHQLLGDIKNITLESALISDDNKNYEISFSYELKGQDPLNFENENQFGQTGLAGLVEVMRYRKQYKTFLIQRKTGTFKGFRNEK